MLLKLFKFCLVGASGMILDFSITYLLKEKVNLHRYIANATGFICAATSNFSFNQYWTFESRNLELYREYGLFITFALIGLMLNTLFLILIERQNLNFYVSKFFAIVLTTLWNFTANYFFTFNGA